LAIFYLIAGWKDFPRSVGHYWKDVSTVQLDISAVGHCV